MGRTREGGRWRSKWWDAELCSTPHLVWIIWRAFPLPPDDLRRDGRACEGRKGNKERVNRLSASSLQEEFLDLWYDVAFLHLCESFSAGKYLHQNMALVGVSKCTRKLRGAAVMFCDLIYYVHEICVVSVSNRPVTKISKYVCSGVADALFRVSPVSRADMTDAWIIW